jgi:hypothetical protein
MSTRMTWAVLVLMTAGAAPKWAHEKARTLFRFTQQSGTSPTAGATPPKYEGGKWKYQTVWDFSRGPGKGPLNIIAGRGSTLFGAASGNGATTGAVFELRPH